MLPGGLLASRVSTFTVEQHQATQLSRARAVTQAAFEAIAKTLPLGSVGYENATNEKGERLIWDRAVVDRLRHLRGPGKSYSDVLRLAADAGA
jgi:hypothetical protein